DLAFRKIRIFLQKELDRANQLDPAGEIRFCAQFVPHSLAEVPALTLRKTRPARPASLGMEIRGLCRPRKARNGAARSCIGKQLTLLLSLHYCFSRALELYNIAQPHRFFNPARETDERSRRQADGFA
ncbi:MAG TPA: hypothetical protein VIM34_15890, partial [Burkholderiaceae bacterium]